MANDVSFRASRGETSLVYRYTVTGSDKASIDTGVDAPDAGSNDWTNGDLLEVFILARVDNAAAATGFLLTFNNDGGSNYDRQVFYANNTTVSASPDVATSSWSFSVHGAGGTANYASAVSVFIPNYAGTTLYKVGTALGGTLDNTASNAFSNPYSLGYRSTSAITRLKIAGNSTDKFKVGSQLLIYKRVAS